MTSGFPVFVDFWSATSTSLMPFLFMSVLSSLVWFFSWVFINIVQMSYGKVPDTFYVVYGVDGNSSCQETPYIFWKLWFFIDFYTLGHTTYDLFPPYLYLPSSSTHSFWPLLFLDPPETSCYFLDYVWIHHSIPLNSEVFRTSWDVRFFSCLSCLTLTS